MSEHPPHLRGAPEAVLEVHDLEVAFPVGRTGLQVRAVAGISFDVVRGETLGIVGESGCGKTSAGRAIMQLPPPNAGTVRFAGTDLTALGRRELRAARTRMQMIFQDPIAALNPRRRVRDIVAEPLHVWKRGSSAEREAVVDGILDAVGIDPARAAESRAHEFSGGQCQRIAIARALVLEPSLLICDEPVSSLDVSVQAQVLNLLEDLKARHALTLVFIAHDLAVVKAISDRVAVMYLGKLCEIGAGESLYRAPAHHYTRLLIDSIPVPDPAATRTAPPIAGEPPSPLFAPTGCRFHTRCPAATELCATAEPPMRRVADDHFVACHHPLVEVRAVERPRRGHG